MTQLGYMAARSKILPALTKSTLIHIPDLQNIILDYLYYIDGDTQRK
jgi:hypothetical protein